MVIGEYAVTHNKTTNEFGIARFDGKYLWGRTREGFLESLNNRKDIELIGCISSHHAHDIPLNGWPKVE